MAFEPFVMERWQSLHEHQVEFNLSDSGVHPVSVRELLNEGDRQALLDERLVYTQTNGTPELRELIASLYPGATAENVQVVNGGAEANFLSIWSLLEPGDELVCMLPNYMQVWGLARSLGFEARGWNLRPDHKGGEWVADVAELEELVGPRTKLIALCNPNNPTGARLDGATLDAISAVAARHGAWILSDEIYQGSDLDGGETPTMWGRHERVIVTNSLSKSYGLPGLRLGWAVAPAERCADLWARHDYTTIALGALSDFVATRALRPDTRARLLARTHELLGQNFARVSSWLEESGELLRVIPPRVGAMLYLSYGPKINSTELAQRLRREKSVLLVPGDQFGMDGWLRIGFGGVLEEIEEGLRRVRELLLTI